MRTSLDLELDLQATRTWHSQLTQEISVLKELKEQLEQAKSHGEKELPQGLREDERFRLLLRMLEKRVSSERKAGEAARSTLGDDPLLQGSEAQALNGSYSPDAHGECGSLVPMSRGIQEPLCPVNFLSHVQALITHYLSNIGTSSVLEHTLQQQI